MAAPTYIGKTAFASGTGSISVNFASLDSGTRQAGDTLIIIVEQANEPIASISGFSKVTDQGTGTAGAAGSVGVQLFYKENCTGSEGSVTVGDAGDHTTAIGIVIRPSTGLIAKLDASTGGTQSVINNGSITIPALTVTDDGLFIFAVGSDRDAASTSNFGLTDNGSGSNFSTPTEIHDETVTAGQGGGIGVWRATRTTGAGTTTGTGAVEQNGGATIQFAKIVAAFKSAALSAPVGRSDEADSALALTPKQIRAIGRADEADTALAVGGKAIRAAGRADETETALALAPVQVIAAGLASETDTALPRGSARPVDASVETDVGLALGSARPVGVGVETDTAHAVVGFVFYGPQEADTAFALASVQIAATGRADEVDSALALSAMLIRAVGRADETDSALRLILSIPAVVPDDRTITWPGNRLENRVINFI